MIEKRLKKLGMSMYQLAQAIGQSDQRTQYIVKKKEFAKDYLLLKSIAKALDCDIKDLLNDDEKKLLKKIEEND